MSDVLTVEDCDGAMADVVAAIGASAALSIVRVYAGGQVYVPKLESMTDEHPLARLLGRPLADKLARHIGGGEPLRIPTLRRQLEREREREIVDRMKRGQTVAHIARAYGVSVRHIYDVRARAKERGDLVTA